jgi:hypothetical protein
MALLLESGRTELWRGDMLRLPENYDLGPDSGPVDLMVYDPNDSDGGLSVIVVSGYKSGLTWSIFPKQSSQPGARCIDIDWLRRNWDEWFCYEWNGRMRVIAMACTEILEWDHRMIVEMP